MAVPEDVVALLKGIDWKVSSALFAVGGLVWVGVAASGSGILLFWPALASFVSALALATFSASRVTRPLAVASAVFGLTEAVYQLIFSVSLAQTYMAALTTNSLALFLAVAVLYLVLASLALAAGKKEEPED